MKKFYISLITLGSLFSTLNAQENSVPVQVDLGVNAKDAVFLKLADNSQHKEEDWITKWDLAFDVSNIYTATILGNSYSGVRSIFRTGKSNFDEVQGAPEDYTATDDMQVINNTANWDAGALNNTSYNYFTPQGNFDYGWGVYNSQGNHMVLGKQVFIISSPGNNNQTEYFKVFIESRYANYKFKYAKWDAGSNQWGETKTVSFADSQYTGKEYVYYNLSENDFVDINPGKWDVLFASYDDNLKEMYGSDIAYGVTGVLTHKNIKTARVITESTEVDPNYKNLSYGDAANIIGHNWKTYNMGAGGYVTNPNLYFYLKNTENNKYYKIHFDAYQKDSNNHRIIEFNNLDLDNMSTMNVGENQKVSVYPNPVTNGTFNLLTEGISQKEGLSIEIYSMTGAKVYQNQVMPNGKFNAFEVNLPLNLPKGVYILKTTINHKPYSTQLIID